jgi:hypothetical protein
MIATPKRRPSIRQRLGELPRVPPGFVVAERPVLTAPAAFDDAVPSALVVFVDGVHARLIPFSAPNGEEVILEHNVEGRRRQGGWALLAQSRYQRVTSSMSEPSTSRPWPKR